MKRILIPLAMLSVVLCSSGALACGGHGPAVAAAVNDFFGQDGEGGTEAFAGSGPNGVVGSDGANSAFFANDSASSVLRGVFSILGGTRIDESTYSLDYNG